MKTLILYDSQYGNTEKAAKAISEALGVQAQVLRVGDLEPEQLAGLEALIVGAPTQGFNPTQPIKDWLQNMPKNSLQGIKVAAFDTRMLPEDVNNAVYTRMAKWFGYAAEKISDQLKKKGGIEVIAPAGFVVMGKEGPLKEGELERAAEWGKAIAGSD